MREMTLQNIWMKTVYCKIVNCYRVHRGEKFKTVARDFKGRTPQQLGYIFRVILLEYHL